MTDLTPWKFAEQHQAIEYYEKLARQAVRKANWKRRVKAFCIAVAVFAVVVFAGQFIRAFL